MERVYVLLGKIFFPRQQEWKQSKNAKLVVYVLCFALVVGLVVMKLLRLLYNAKH
jgi:uncharacterized membrane protein SirB2